MMTTNDQLELDWSPIKPDQYDSSIATRFVKFHQDNPAVYRNLVALARVFRGKAQNINRKLGIQMLFEVLRWNYYMTTKTDEKYKLNNVFAAPYSRLIMAQEPDLEDAFNLRTSVVD